MARRIRRTVGIYAVVAVAGLVPSIFDASPRWRAFGLGLVAPGGGFLYTSDPVFLVLTLGAALVAFAIFLFLRANHVALPAVWLTAAIGASLRTHTGLWDWAVWAVPATAVGVLAGVSVRSRVMHRQARVRGARRNGFLSDIHFEPRARPDVPPIAAELSPTQLATQRWALDLTLQPVDSFAGFDTRDPYLMGAPRYQCNWLQWALALGQYAHTPAFSGYVDLAQRNLIEKMTDRRVWEYWRTENLFGNLDPNPDPIRRDNIMYSGYYALMLEVYASNTGDRRYDEPGVIPLRWNDRREFRYDAGSIAGAVCANFQGSGKWAMFPCEPGFVFPACNMLGLSALTIRDRRLGTSTAKEILPGFRRTLDQEFTAADGAIISNAFARYGFSNTLLLMLVAEVGQGLWVHPLAPDVATRIHEVLRREQVSIDDGRVEFHTTGLARRMERSDPGNNKRSPLFLYTAVRAFAEEMGDAELAGTLAAQAEAEGEAAEVDGARSFPDASTFTNAYWAFAALGRPSGWYDLVNHGSPEAWRRGPVLADAPYPDVLVARAVTDGRDLQLVLRPGNGTGRHRLRIDRLEPGGAYAATGTVDATVTAAPDGTAHLDVDLDDRLEVRLAPVA